MARHIIVCRSTFSAPSADPYAIISMNIAITRWRDHTLRAARPYAIEAIRQPITATSGAAICNHSERVTFSPPIRCGPMSKIASRDRDKHSCGCERREPAQDSNGQGLLHLISTCRPPGRARLNCRGARSDEHLIVQAFAAANASTTGPSPYGELSRRQ